MVWALASHVQARAQRADHVRYQVFCFVCFNEMKKKSPWQHAYMQTVGWATAVICMCSRRCRFADAAGKWSLLIFKCSLEKSLIHIYCNALGLRSSWLVQERTKDSTPTGSLHSPTTSRWAHIQPGTQGPPFAASRKLNIVICSPWEILT